MKKIILKQLLGICFTIFSKWLFLIYYEDKTYRNTAKKKIKKARRRNMKKAKRKRN